MYFFDFLSESPNNFIFKKKTNKNNCGGLLSFICIIFMIITFLLYTIEYINKDKYEYDCSTVFNFSMSYIGDDPNLNPKLKFEIKLYEDKSFILKDCNEHKILEWNYNQGSYSYMSQRRVSDFCLEINYLCEDSNCSSLENYKENDEVLFLFGYNGFEIDHQNDIPLVINDHYSNMYFERYSPLNNYEKTNYWEVIEYKEEKSIYDIFSKKKDDIIYGYIKETKINSKNGYKKEDIFYDKEANSYEKSFIKMKFSNPHITSIEFKRKRKVFLDVIVKIASLFSTFKFFLSLIFKYYSENFNNYKIIEKIFNEEKSYINIIELNKTINSSNYLINNENIKDIKKENSLEIDINKNLPLVPKKEGEYIDDYNINKNEDEIDSVYNNNELKKILFFDFFFNNIYSKCCKKIKNQEIINICNETIYNYLSIDSLLINQIKFENMLKDYEWNNPSLNNVQNNHLIIKLKKII